MTRKVKAYRAVRICQLVQLGNRWTDFYKTWYEICAVEGSPIAAIFNLMQLVILLQRVQKSVRADRIFVFFALQPNLGPFHFSY
jgi:hypothetical protein